MSKLLLWVVGISLVAKVQSTCSFPSDIQGTWTNEDGRRGTWHIGPHHISGLNVKLEPSLTVDCDTESKEKTYVLKAERPKLMFGHNLDRYLCVKLQMNSGKLYYTILTKYVTWMQDRVQGSWTHFNTITDFSELCSGEGGEESGTMTRVDQGGLTRGINSDVNIQNVESNLLEKIRDLIDEEREES